MTVGTRARRVVVVGNPNTGKSTVFNVLTGLRQRVGNYPGVTVERKVGRFAEGVDLVDLPGAYSLAARSPDERLVLEALTGRLNGQGTPDAILFIADASNLRRNLYLFTQILELGRPIVVALNMVDAAERAGVRVHAEALASHLGVPVVPIVATRGDGVPALRLALDEALLVARRPVTSFDWPPAISSEIDQISPGATGERRLLAGRAIVDLDGAGAGMAAAAKDAHARIRAQGSLPAALEAKARYAWIDPIVNDVCERREVPPTWGDRVDVVALHPVAGPLLFLGVMTALFMSIFVWASPIMGVIDAAFGGLGSLASRLLDATPLAGGMLESLLVQGVIAGVGSVVIFLPQIAILFFFIGLLEDGGYLARCAHLMDRTLRFCGMSGHSVVPLLSSFACAVPGVMATRTIPSKRDRLLTMMVAPLMSCSARIPVYALLIAAFVPNRLVAGFLPLPGVVFAAMYVVGIAVAIPVAYLLRRTVLKGQGSAFMMELPRYKRPSLRNVLIRVIERSRAFLVQAGTVILAVSILIWALGYFPRSASVREPFDRARVEASASLSGSALEARRGEIDAEEAGAYLRQSFLGRMGAAIEPALAPLGWDWRIGVAVLASFPAREVVVSTLGILYDLGEVDAGDAAGRSRLIDRLRAARFPDGRVVFTLPVALSVLVFFALCCQCGATLATIRRESNSWRTVAFVFSYMTLLAYAGAWLTAGIGRALVS